MFAHTILYVYFCCTVLNGRINFWSTNSYLINGKQLCCDYNTQINPPHIIGYSHSILASFVEYDVSENLLHPEAEGPQLKCCKHYGTCPLLKKQQKFENILAQRKNLVLLGILSIFLNTVLKESIVCIWESTC